MKVEIARCRVGDVGDVEGFLDRHWSRGHVLARSRALLDFQHRAGDDRYDLLVARRDGDAEPLGLLGFIRASRYDPALAGDKTDTLWLTTWMVRPDAGMSGLGLRLHRHLLATVPHRAVGTVGNNAAAEAIYRALGYRTGVLDQHYLLRPGRRRFALARVPEDREHALDDRPDSRHDIRGDIVLRPLGRDRLLALDALPLGARAGRPPVKTPRYFAHRYLDHPIYRYRVLALERAGRPLALLALRAAEHDGAKALRLVDYLGAEDALAGSAGAFVDLLERHDAEYADVLSSGVAPAAFAAAGFRRLDAGGPVVIPSYFEPFERRNVRIRFAFDGPGEPVLLKADADQDRPNRLPGDPR